MTSAGRGIAATTDRRTLAGVLAPHPGVHAACAQRAREREGRRGLIRPLDQALRRVDGVGVGPLEQLGLVEAVALVHPVGRRSRAPRSSGRSCSRTPPAGRPPCERSTPCNCLRRKGRSGRPVFSNHRPAAIRQYYSAGARRSNVVWSDLWRTARSHRCRHVGEAFSLDRHGWKAAPTENPAPAIDFHGRRRVEAEHCAAPDTVLYVDGCFGPTGKRANVSRAGRRMRAIGRPKRHADYPMSKMIFPALPEAAVSKASSNFSKG